MASEHATPAGSHESSPTHAPAPVPGSPLSAAPEFLPAGPAALLANPHLGGRGNGPRQQAAILQLQRTHGNRAVQRMLSQIGSSPAGSRVPIAIQRALTNTMPNWAPVDASGEGSEVTVDAIGPGKTPTQGSAPTKDESIISVRRQKLFIKATAKGQYVQGHLLNHNIGGPGDKPENLTAFPNHITNQDHKNLAEKLVKDGSKAGKWFKYHVKVNYGTDSLPALLKATGYDPLSVADQKKFATDWKVNLDPTTDKVFRYADGLLIEWEELDFNSGATIKGTENQVVLSIPSPLSYIRGDEDKRGLAYPGKDLSEALSSHSIKWKGKQTWTKPIGPAYANAKGTFTSNTGRPYEEPVAWKAIADAQKGTPDAAKLSSTAKEDKDYKRGVEHYADGWKAAQAGKEEARYGKGYTAGQTDYNEGMLDAQSGLVAHTTNPGQQAGHADYLAGLKAAQAKQAKPKETAASTAYQEYLDGVAYAAASLAQYEGAAPKEVAKKAGFDEYREGAEANKGGKVNNPNRPGFAQGWADFAAGRQDWDSAVQANTPPQNIMPKQAGGGYLAGFHYAAGVAVARADLASPAPTGSQSLASGHTDYVGGYTAARGNLNAPTPAPYGGATGHGDYQAGVNGARTNPGNGAPPDSGAAAGFKDYQDGIAAAQANPAAMPPAPSGAALGFADYRAGAAFARASLVNLTGPAPAPSGEAAGFADYLAGVNGFKNAQPQNTGGPIFAQGWQDYRDGRHDFLGNTVNALRTESGYLQALADSQAAQQNNKRSGTTNTDDPKKLKTG